MHYEEKDICFVEFREKSEYTALNTLLKEINKNGNDERCILISYLNLDKQSMQVQIKIEQKNLHIDYKF